MRSMATKTKKGDREDIPPRAREIITPSAYDHEERVLRRTLTQAAREKERPSEWEEAFRWLRRRCIIPTGRTEKKAVRPKSKVGRAKA